MKYITLTTLLLLVFGIAFIGCHGTSDPQIQKGLIDKYTGPQTIESLMEAFDDRYSSKASNAKWTMAIDISYGQKHQIDFTLVDIDARYPREEWLQMLLNKGVTIDNFEAYDRYLNIRAILIAKEFRTSDHWETMKLPNELSEIIKLKESHTRDDSETAKTRYIDTLIQRYQRSYRLTTEAK
ncbi:MAG: hypothetical protein OXI63_01470 [Candidatus Poribacteria bacterium]|nr:hypothetical protein [Candidatus Poribacteria bacterium]